MVITNATPKDATQISNLLTDLNYPQIASHFQKRFFYYLNTPNYYVLVAQEGDIILGLVSFVLTQLFVTDAKRCQIEALVVNPAHRKKGVGRALMSEAEKNAFQMGATVIELTSSMYREKDTGAHSFYKSIGYARDFESVPPRAYFRKKL